MYIGEYTAICYYEEILMCKINEVLVCMNYLEVLTLYARSSHIGTIHLKLHYARHYIMLEIRECHVFIQQ